MGLRLSNWYFWLLHDSQVITKVPNVVFENECPWNDVLRNMTVLARLGPRKFRGTSNVSMFFNRRELSFAGNIRRCSVEIMLLRTRLRSPREYIEFQIEAWAPAGGCP